MHIILNREQVFQMVGDAKVVIEIGACNGDDTRRLLNRFRNAKVYSVEPKPNNIKLWKDNIHNDRAYLYEGVISDHNGVVKLYCSEGKYIGASSIRKPTEKLLRLFKGLTFSKEVLVDSLTLDAFVGRYCLNEIDFLWIDTQGAEKNIIVGGSVALQNTKFLFIEYAINEHYVGQILIADMLKELDKFGFKVKGYFQENVFLSNVNKTQA